MSAHERAEEELRESEALAQRRLAELQTIYTSAPVGLAFVDRDLRFVRVNEALAEFNGFPVAEHIGRTLGEVLPSKLAKEIEPLYRRVIETGEPVTDQELKADTHAHPGNMQDWLISYQPVKDAEGKVLGVNTVVQEITERKPAEEARARLLSQEQAARAEAEDAQRRLTFLAEAGEVLSSSLDYGETLARVARLTVPRLADWCAVDVLKEDGSIVRLAVVHEDPEKVELAHELQERYPPDPDAPYGVSKVVRTGEPELIPEIPDSLLDEAVHDAELRETLRALGLKSSIVVPLVARGRTLGAITLISAESGRRYGRADQELAEDLARRAAVAVDNARLYEEAQKEIVERKRAKKALVEVREAERSSIARDLHDGALQDLSYALVEAEIAKMLSENQEVNDRLKREIEALRRAEQGLREAVYDLRLGGEAHSQPFDRVLKHLVEQNQRMNPECEIELVLEEGFLSIPLGEKGIEVLRILQEALTNARRHSGATSILVSLRAEGNDLVAEVADDGRGFGPDTAPGMGLRSMHERARALGGDLKIQSEPGKGTRVRFEMLLESEDGEESGSEGETRVLLVEDHVSFREAAASIFEREPGFEVVGQVGSLAEARNMLEHGTTADVTIVDLGLPDGYGGELIKELREADPRSQALVLSASFDRAEIARAVESGAAGVLHKSASMNEVVDAVRRLRAGQTLLPLEEVVELLRFAGVQREQEHEARRAIAQLTPREKEVLWALAEGLDGREIAERLNISVETERNHVTRILSKLGVHSRLQAVVFAIRYGLAEIPRQTGEG